MDKSTLSIIKPPPREPNHNRALPLAIRRYRADQEEAAFLLPALLFAASATQYFPKLLDLAGSLSPHSIVILSLTTSGG